MKFTARVIDGWLPLIPEAISALEWQEGDTIEIEICGDTLLAHKIEDRPAPKSSKVKKS